MPTLFVDKLLEDPNSQIGIVFKDATIRGFVTEESTLFDTQSTYSELLDMNAAQFAAQAPGILGKAGEAAARASGHGGSRFIQQTILSWDGTNRPPFIIGMKFIATKEGDDPRIPAVNLMKRCLPQDGNSSTSGDFAAFLNGIPGIGGNVLTSPNGYTGATSEILGALETGVGLFGGAGAGGFGGITSHGVTGTCHLIIGQWFMAMNLILTQANFEVGRTVMKNGIPLICEGRVHLEPYMWMSETEFANCFIGATEVSGSPWITPSGYGF